MNGAAAPTVEAVPGDPTAAAVILPALNEAAHIGPLLTYLTSAAWMAAHIVVADGGSDDGTREIVAEFVARDPRVRLLHNPGRRQSAGVNLAVASLPDAVTAFVRMDVHACYPDDFVARALASLYSSGADSVGVPLRTVGGDCFQKAVAEACNSVLGTGGAAHRVSARSAFVDHAHHAAFARMSFERIGGYDEAFATNEDAELDARLTRAGGRIWMNSDLPVQYFPRRDVSALARQYFRYGAGRAQNVRKNRLRMRLRQLAPAVLVALLAWSLIAAPAWPATLGIPALYVACVCVIAAASALWRRDPCLLGLAVVLPAIHLSWGAGFIVSWVKISLTRRSLG